MDLAKLRASELPDLDSRWIEHPDDPSFRVKIARLGNRGMRSSTQRAAYASRLRAMRETRGQEDLDPDAMADELMMEAAYPYSDGYRRAFAKHCILDWEGLTDAGEPVPATEEHRLSLCLDEATEQVYDWLHRESVTLQSEYDKARIADLGNSEGSSSGKPATATVSTHSEPLPSEEAE